jgi:hypothetical protein
VRDQEQAFVNILTERARYSKFCRWRQAGSTRIGHFVRIAQPSKTPPFPNAALAIQVGGFSRLTVQPESPSAPPWHLVAPETHTAGLISIKFPIQPRRYSERVYVEIDARGRRVANARVVGKRRTGD